MKEGGRMDAASEVFAGLFINQFYGCILCGLLLCVSVASTAAAIAGHLYLLIIKQHFLPTTIK